MTNYHITSDIFTTICQILIEVKLLALREIIISSRYKQIHMLLIMSTEIYKSGTLYIEGCCEMTINLIRVIEFMLQVVNFLSENTEVTMLCNIYTSLKIHPMLIKFLNINNTVFKAIISNMTKFKKESTLSFKKGNSPE